MSTKRKSYSELILLDTFEERFNYLKIGAEVGCATFGGNRWINQQFYTSREWRRLRHHAISRDEACDLGVEGYEIYDNIIVHHINPIDEDDIMHGTEAALSLDNLICTTLRTHNAIHFGDESQIVKPYIPRRAGDTQLWPGRRTT